MQKSGFFNAIMENGVPDRRYNANDYRDNLAVVIGNGVLRSTNDDLKVTASGMTVSVGVGRAWINGAYYFNDSSYSFAGTQAPTGGSRIDRVMLRFNNALSARNVSLVYVQGTASNTPVAPAPTRSGNVYDLVLADITVAANATSVGVIDRRSDANLCGWVYSTSGDNSFFTSLDNNFMSWFNEKKNTLASVTLFKCYTWEKVLTAAATKVSFSISQYDPDTCFIEVYINGILDNKPRDYSISGSVITFVNSLIAGTVVTVKCYKSIDGTGIMSVADEITALQNAVAAIQGNAKFVYMCTGVNDNASLSDIAQAIISGSYTASNVTEAAASFLQKIGGNSYLSSLSSSAQVEIEIVGKLGISSAYSGSGTSVSPYRYFSLGSATKIEKRITFNFNKCDIIDIVCVANAENSIFYGADINIKGARVNAHLMQAGCNIIMIDSANNKGRINIEGCRFTVKSTGSARIAEHGTFTNCYGYCLSDASTAYCFKPKQDGLIRLMGGEFYAYGRTSSGIGSCIMHTSESDVDAVLLAYNIHCPVVTLANYSQGFLSVANAGNTIINGVVSRLTSSGSYNTITGLVNKNKA